MVMLTNDNLSQRQIDLGFKWCISCDTLALDKYNHTCVTPVEKEKRAQEEFNLAFKKLIRMPHKHQFIYMPLDYNDPGGVTVLMCRFCEERAIK